MIITKDNIEFRFVVTGIGLTKYIENKGFGKYVVGQEGRDAGED